MYDDELYHYGKIGMKWGHRKAKPSSKKSKSQKKSASPPHEDHVKAYSKKKVIEMSDAELRNRINRIQMEKQYNKITTENTNKGKIYADKVIKSAATVAAVSTTAITLANNAGKIKDIVQKASSNKRQITIEQYLKSK